MADTIAAAIPFRSSDPALNSGPVATIPSGTRQEAYTEPNSSLASSKGKRNKLSDFSLQHGGYPTTGII